MNDLVDQQELRRAASHEAGHAIVGVRLAVPFDYVEVRIDGTGGFDLPSSGDESALPELARKQVI